MNIKKATAERLLAIPALVAIVGDRVYRKRLPQKVTIKPPHIIVWLLSKDRIVDHDGYAYTEATLQISCFSYDPDQADNMAVIVRESLESWPSEGTVMDSFFEGEDDLFEESTLVYHVALDFKISYHE